MTRKEFIGGALAATAGAMTGCATARTFTSGTRENPIKAVLLSAGMAEWGLWAPPGEPRLPGQRYTVDHIRFSEEIWLRTTNYMAEKGLNMVFIDLGEFLEYPSHPELAVKGSWKAERLRTELARLRGMGIEPIPKLNFSSDHDSWLKEYNRMLSTPTYYRVVKDLMRDVSEIFDRPRFIHVGLDEENLRWTKNSNLIVLRQGALWWHDVRFYHDTALEFGMRPCMWDDREAPGVSEEMLKNIPKDMIITPAYYDDWCAGYELEGMAERPRSILMQSVNFAKAGYDVIPCGSNYIAPIQERNGWKVNDKCMGGLVKFGREHVDPKHLLGFMMASWSNVADECNWPKNKAGIDQLAAAMKS